MYLTVSPSFWNHIPSFSSDSHQWKHTVAQTNIDILVLNSKLTKFPGF